MFGHPVGGELGRQCFSNRCVWWPLL